VVEGDESPKIIEQSILEYCKHLSTMTDYQGALEFIRSKSQCDNETELRDFIDSNSELELLGTYSIGKILFDLNRNRQIVRLSLKNEDSTISSDEAISSNSKQSKKKKKATDGEVFNTFNDNVCVLEKAMDKIVKDIKRNKENDYWKWTFQGTKPEEKVMELIQQSANDFAQYNRSLFQNKENISDKELFLKLMYCVRRGLVKSDSNNNVSILWVEIGKCVYDKK